MTKEQLIDKIKELATDFWAMNLHNGTFESHLREIIDRYEQQQ